MDIEPQGLRLRRRGMVIVLAALLALALALAVNRVVVSSGTIEPQPPTGAGNTSTHSGPAYVLAPDAQDRNDRASLPVAVPSQPSPDDGRRLPH